MRFDVTISRASLIGMVVVSWLSILVLGGAWIVQMYFEFRSDSDQLRTEHYSARRAEVKGEVEKAAALVDAIRRARLDDLTKDIHHRVALAESLGKSLVLRLTPRMSNGNIRATLVDVLGSEVPGVSGLYAVRGKTVYLLTPFPRLIDKQKALDRIVDALKDVDPGDRQFFFDAPGDGHRYTMLVTVKQFDRPAMRVVSGACLEVADAATKLDVIRQLESVRYGAEGILFGGTWRGDTLIGPAKGRNMWNITDADGVKIVQELVTASQRGGGFVSYVMPLLENQRHTDKISYAMSVNDWGWYIGTGLYVDDIESVIVENRARLERNIMQQAGVILGGLIFLSLVAFGISQRLSRKMQDNIRFFTNVWNRASSKGIEIDADALYYKEFKDLAKAANLMEKERRIAEDSLADSVQQFEVLVANIPGIVYHCENNSSWTMKYISSSALDVTGYPAADFIDNEIRSFGSIIHPDDRAWVVAAIAEDVKQQKPFSVEYRIIRADGEVRWVSERGKAQHIGDETPAWLDGVIFDVSDRRQAGDEHYGHLHFLETMERVDRAVRRSDDIKTMLSDVLETVRQAFDSDRVWLLYPCDPNSPTYKIPMERTAPEFPGALTLGKDVPMDDESREVFALVLESKAPLAFDPTSEHKIPAATFKSFSVRSQLVTALYPRLGEPWMMGMHQCRNARIWNEDELQLFKEICRRVADALSSMLMIRQLHDSEEKFRTFSQQTMLGLCVIQDDHVVFANQAYCDIFEISIEDMLALPPGGFIELVHPDDRDFLMEQARKKQEGDSDVVPSYIWRALTSTGRVRWVEIYSRTIILGGRKADLVSLVDITEKKQAEENLEQVISERTQALAHKAGELEKANVRLMKLDEMKSSFLTTVSHDLRTPLTSVLGYAKLVRRDLKKSLDVVDNECVPEQERIINNLAVMEAEGERLTRLIDDFLDLTSIEAGAGKWYDKIISVDDYIFHIMKQVEIRVGVKSGVELVLDIVGELPEMTLDPDRFEQLLANLLTNAIRYTQKGKITLRVESPDGRGLEIKLSDTGKGMPRGELNAIFDAFHQVEGGDTLVDEIKGSGLGLSFCRLIVEHYGGKIWAKSTLGQGSTFYLTLPGSLDS